MHAPVAPSMWKLTSVPTTHDPIATADAMASIRWNRSVRR